MVLVGEWGGLHDILSLRNFCIRAETLMLLSFYVVCLLIYVSSTLDFYLTFFILLYKICYISNFLNFYLCHFDILYLSNKHNF